MRVVVNSLTTRVENIDINIQLLVEADIESNRCMEILGAEVAKLTENMTSMTTSFENGMDELMQLLTGGGGAYNQAQ